MRSLTSFEMTAAVFHFTFKYMVMADYDSRGLQIPQKKKGKAGGKAKHKTKKKK